LPLMWRSVSVISAVVRTIMTCLLERVGQRDARSARRVIRRTAGSGVLLGEDVVDSLVADLDATIALVVGQRERGEELDDLVARAGGLDQHLVVEAARHRLAGQVRILEERDTERHATAAELELALVLVDQRREALTEDATVLEGA